MTGHGDLYANIITRLLLPGSDTTVSRENVVRLHQNLFDIVWGLHDMHVLWGDYIVLNKTLN